MEQRQTVETPHPMLMNVTDTAEPAWYCIRTKRYKEALAAQRLGTLCDEVYLPLLRRQRRLRRQIRWVTEPLFPCYLFARFSFAERFQSIRYTLGVANVVGTQAGRPTEVDPGIITILRHHAPQGYVEILPEPFVLGEEVEIIDGPFHELDALFQRELKAGERVTVLLEILSSHVLVELPKSHIQKRRTQQWERLCLSS